MVNRRHYDTVAYDVRDNAYILFFARTSDAGDIEDYILLMRAEGEQFDDSIYLELNEKQFAGHDLIETVDLTGAMLTLSLRDPAKELGGIVTMVLTYDDTAENKKNVERGAFSILGDTLKGGHA